MGETTSGGGPADRQGRIDDVMLFSRPLDTHNRLIQPISPDLGCHGTRAEGAQCRRAPANSSLLFQQLDRFIRVTSIAAAIKGVRPVRFPRPVSALALQSAATTATHLLNTGKIETTRSDLPSMVVSPRRCRPHQSGATIVRVAHVQWCTLLN